ncbi:MAG: Maf family nucleotide pyrophosphatase [Burkholderiales bacterium]|nr:Maf family nucleotide pyrophosphatase [Burkholderiales bacterium]
MASTPRLILASTSRYRAELLTRLGLPFEAVAPGVDEATLPGEPAEAAAARLARAKALAVAAQHADSVVIGSDQVAVCDGMRLDKPGDRVNAIRQLTAVSGRTVVFHTAVCVVGPTARHAETVVPTVVAFRTLTPAVIERYVDREQPFDCAGSAKAESLGIALIARMEGTDPTALIGLPLIALTDLLAQHGLPVL